jgi:hypothetical protein
MTEAWRRQWRWSPEAEAVAKRIRTILNKATLLDKGIKIPNLERFIWT